MDVVAAMLDEQSVLEAVIQAIPKCGLDIVADLMHDEEPKGHHSCSVPRLADMCIKSMVFNGNLCALHDESIPMEQKKTMRRLNKDAVARRKYEKTRVLIAPAPPQFEGHTMRGVPKRPFVKWIARVLYEWMRQGRIPLAFPVQQVLRELDPFPLEEQLSKRVEAIARDWATLGSEERVALLVDLFKCCGKRGILRMLNMRHTAGSQEGFLPPSHACLLAAFNAQHVKGETTVSMTVGGRALAKHCGRDRTLAWWGSVSGTPAVVNWHAQDVILRILDNATWCNIHILPHNVKIFEARVTEGYGARWLADGSEFRGFLEPHSEDGHESGWIH